MASTHFHPELRRAARWLPKGVGRPWLVPVLRRLPPPRVLLPANISVSDHAIKDTTATLRVFRPSGAGARPAVLWMHGGGYVMGAARQDDAICARLAEHVDAVVVAVDYRLAPDHPFPTPLEDCFRALEAVRRDAAAFGVDPARVIFAGQSAGGGLAAALALLVLDRGQPPPILQVLIYPMLDDRTVLRAVDGRMHRLWNQASNRYGWRCYLGQEPGGPDVKDHAAPARRVNVAGLPPTWIGVGTHDLFFDEDVAWAKRLGDAGVSTTLEIVDGAFHGFDAALPGKPVSRAFFDKFVHAMKTAIQDAGEG